MKNLCFSCKMRMREIWIKKHIENRISAPELANLSGFHKNTIYNWKQKYLGHEIEGLKDQSRAPYNHPNEYPDEIKTAIQMIRAKG